MKKEFKETGPNGTYRGVVQIIKKTELLEVENRILHDSYLRPITSIKVEAAVLKEDSSIELVYESGVIKGSNHSREVMEKIEEAEKTLQLALLKLANDPPPITLDSLLKEKGYF
jgi:hypothetical protein